MGINITTLDEAIEDNGLKIAVHGPAGAGKTVLCATARAPTLIISAESGLLSLKNAPASVKKMLRIQQVSNISEVREIRDHLIRDTMGCEWIVLDSASEIAEQCLKAEKQFANDPRQAYGKLIEEMTEIFKTFRDLPRINVMMTFKQGKFMDNGMTTYAPRLPGQNLGVDVPYLFDELLALRVMQDDDGNEIRQLQTRRDLQYEAKDRSGMLRKFEPANLAHIAGVIHGDIEVALEDDTPDEPDEVSQPEIITGDLVDG